MEWGERTTRFPQELKLLLTLRYWSQHKFVFCHRRTPKNSKIVSRVNVQQSYIMNSFSEDRIIVTLQIPPQIILLISIVRILFNFALFLSLF